MDFLVVSVTVATGVLEPSDEFFRLSLVRVPFVPVRERYVLRLRLINVSSIWGWVGANAALPRGGDGNLRRVLDVVSSQLFRLSSLLGGTPGGPSLKPVPYAWGSNEYTTHRISV